MKRLVCFILIFGFLYAAMGFPLWANPTPIAVSGQPSALSPGFIQSLHPKDPNYRIGIKPDEPLNGKLALPMPGDLLSAAVPIYGVAGGKDFKEFRVEYGLGSSPKEWHLIMRSDKPQLSFSTKDLPDRLMGYTGKQGNLATWNTGLKNWEHLPWHPASDPTDMNGTYTIRLIVIDKANRRVEDRVVVQVGRAIAQCLAGIACNDTKDIILYFDEHSITSGFRVYAIGEIASPPSSLPYASPVYKISEAGERFLKPVRMSIKASENHLQKLKASDRDKLSISCYTGSNWISLPTFFDPLDSSYNTLITELPPQSAIFALLCDPGLDKPALFEPKPVLEIAPNQGEILCRDDFGSGFSEWKAAEHPYGANLQIVESGRSIKNPALLISNVAPLGNFECTVRSTPFDAFYFNKMSFWYKIPPGINIDMMFKLEDRWYALGLSSSQADTRYKDVNITTLGQFPGLKTDNTWRFAEARLCDIFSRCTASNIVQEIKLAGWKVNGYMNLDFAPHPVGASFLIEDFSIMRDNRQSRELKKNIFPGLMNEESSNGFGFSSGGNCYSNVSPETLPGKLKTLRIDYSVSEDEGFAGWYYDLKQMDIASQGLIRVRAKGVSSDALWGIMSANRVERKVRMQDFISAKLPEGWQVFEIPLVYFGLVNLRAITKLSLSLFSEGRIHISEISFDSYNPTYLKVLDFSTAHNLFGWDTVLISSGKAVIDSTKSQAEITLSYSGEIGKDMGYEGFSWCGWDIPLSGVDLRSYDTLRLKLKGNSAKDYVNIYLDDGNKRWPYELKLKPGAKGEYHSYDIPLQHFRSNKLDLGCIARMQFIWEWQSGSGSISVSEIGFTNASYKTLSKEAK